MKTLLETITLEEKDRFTDDALEYMGGIFEMNQTEEHIVTVASTINRLMLRTGSCLLISGKNIPSTCRYGITMVQELRPQDDIYFPLCPELLSTKPHPADPMLFCVIGSDTAAMSYEWEYFYEKCRLGELAIPNVSDNELKAIDKKVHKRIRQIRESNKRQLERKKNVK